MDAAALEMGKGSPAGTTGWRVYWHLQIGNWT